MKIARFRHSFLVRRQIDRPDNLHAVVQHGFAGPRELAVAARFRGQIDDDRAGLHALDHGG